MKVTKGIQGILLAVAIMVLIAVPVSAYTPGDANNDGKVNMLDIAYIEMAILGLTTWNESMDANQNGIVDMADVIYVERVVLLKSPIIGDANGDGHVDKQDITKVQQIILLRDSPTPGADVNHDGRINMLDVALIDQMTLK